MAPFSLASLTETLTLLMNTPLVPVDSSTAPRDVPLTEMPTSNRQARESRRQSNSSSVSASSHSSSLSSGTHDESVTFAGLSHVRGPPLFQSSPQRSLRQTPRTPSPLSPSSSKELPPLPESAHHNSRVRFADDVDVEF